MKKIYLSIFAVVLMFSAQAQLSLTQAFNEPVVGDVNTKMAFDSVGVLPLNTGANQTWDFSSLAGDTIVDVTTFTTVASTPNGTNYAGSTLADSDGQGTYNYYKSTGTQYELVGIDDPNLSINLSNTAIAAIWPITMGYSNTDVFSGTATSSQAGSGPATGTITTVASGTGTLILPGGASYANVLQVKALQTVDVSLGGGFFNITVVNTDYTYYHSSQKFPLLTVSYSEISGVFSNSSATIRINSYVAVGLKDLKLDKYFGGIYSKNELPKHLMRKKFYIINLQSSDDGEGSDWTCFCFNQPLTSIYFDPFGFIAPKEVQNRISPYF